MPRVGDTAKFHSSDLCVCITTVHPNSNLVDCFYWIADGENAGPGLLRNVHEYCLTEYGRHPLLREAILAGQIVSLRCCEKSPLLYVNRDSESLLGETELIWVTGDGELLEISVPTMALQIARNPNG